MDDVGPFCCQNPDCPDVGKRGHGNLTVTVRYGRARPVGCSGARPFQLRDDRDTTWSSSDRFGKKWVVVYFYPGDFTPGCTAQARAFSAAIDKLTEKDVVGVSGDAIATHALFKKAQEPNFTLLADPDGTVAKQFGVPVGKGDGEGQGRRGQGHRDRAAATLARWTFVVGPDGKVAYKNARATPADAKKITEFVTGADKK